LKVCFTKRKSGGAAVNDNPNHLAVAFAKTGHGENLAQAI